MSEPAPRSCPDLPLIPLTLHQWLLVCRICGNLEGLVDAKVIAADSPIARSLEELKTLVGNVPKPLPAPEPAAEAARTA